MMLHHGGTVVLVLGLTAPLPVKSTAAPPEVPTVGMRARIDQLVLPGPELEAVEIRDRTPPMVVRILDVYPHGPSAFRYDIEYYGLEPGTHDVRSYLKRKDGSSTANLPPILVPVRPVLPPGQIEPNALVLKGTPRPGGYRVLVIVGAVLWLAGLAGILLLGRRRRRDEARASEPPATLAERLRPLVERAMAGQLDAGQHAELERLLIGYWRRRLNLETAPPAESMALLRRHREAGPLFRGLEAWLHNPDGPREPVDVGALLEPYRDLPADALEVRPPEGPPR